MKRIVRRKKVILIIVFLLLILSFLLFRGDSKKIEGKTNTIEFTQVAAGKKKVNLVKMESTITNGIVLCSKFVATYGLHVTVTGGYDYSWGSFSIPTNTVACKTYSKVAKDLLTSADLSGAVIKEAYCVDPVKGEAEGDYVIDKSMIFINQMLNGLVAATHTEYSAAVSGVRTLAFTDGGVQKVGECALKGNEVDPSNTKFTKEQKNATCRFWRGYDPGSNPYGGDNASYSFYGWKSSTENALKQFNPSVMSGVSSIRAAAASSANSSLVNYNSLANIHFDTSYDVTKYNKCEGGTCSVEVTFTGVVPNGYVKKQMKLNVASEFTKYDCTVKGVDLVCSFEFPSSKLSKIKETVIIAGVELNPTGDAGVALLLKPEYSENTKQNLIVVDKTPKWLQFAFKFELEQEPCDEFYEIIKNNSVDKAWDIISKKYSEKEIDECCLYPDTKNPKEYAIEQTENGKKFFDKYCSCDFLLKTLDAKFTGLKDVDDAKKRYSDLEKSSNEEYKYMQKHLKSTAKDSKVCCYKDYVPPSKYPEKYIENSYPIFYNAFCENSCQQVLTDNKTNIKKMTDESKLLSLLKEEMGSAGLELGDDLCCDDIKNKMNVSGAPTVYKKYYDKYCQPSCDDLVEKVKNKEKLDKDDKNYIKNNNCCDSFTKEQIESNTTLKEICPQADVCEVSGFKVHCDPDNTNPIDNYLVYEAYSGNPEDKYNPAYDNYAGCVVDVEFNREAYLDNNANVNYEIDGKSRFTESDAKKNSYYLSSYNTNRYCRISCSERWEFQFSAFQNFVGYDKIQNTLSGMYFDLTRDLYLKGQTTCVTTYIDYELYVEELKAYSIAERAAYNTNKEAEKLKDEALNTLGKEQWRDTDENGHVFMWHGEGKDFDEKWCIRLKSNAEHVAGPYCCKWSTCPADAKDCKPACLGYCNDFTYFCAEYGTCEQGFMRNSKPKSITAYNLKTGSADNVSVSGGATQTAAQMIQEYTITLPAGESPPVREARINPVNGKPAREDTCELATFDDGGQAKKDIEDAEDNNITVEPVVVQCGRGCSIVVGYNVSYSGSSDHVSASSPQQYYSVSDGATAESAREAYAGRADYQDAKNKVVAGKIADAKTKILLDKMKYGTSISDYTFICPYEMTLGGEEYTINVERSNGSAYIKKGESTFTSNISSYSESLCCDDSKYRSALAKDPTLASKCSQYRSTNGTCDKESYWGREKDRDRKWKDPYARDEYSDKKIYYVNGDLDYSKDVNTTSTSCVLLGSGQSYDSAMNTSGDKVNIEYKGEVNGRVKDMTECQNYYLVNGVSNKNEGPDGQTTNLPFYNYSSPDNFGLSMYENSFTEKKEWYIVGDEDNYSIESHRIDSALPVLYYPNNTNGCNNGLGYMFNKRDAETGAISSPLKASVSTAYKPKASYEYEETDYMNMLLKERANFIVTDNKKNERISKINNDDGKQFNVSGGTDSADGKSRVIYINKLKTQAYASSSPWSNNSSHGKQYSGNVVYDSDKGNKVDAKTQKLYLCGLGGTDDKALLDLYEKAAGVDLISSSILIKEGCYHLDLYYYPVNYIKQSVTNSSFYENYGNFFFNLDKENGKIKSTWAVDKEAASLKIGKASSLASDRVGVFPVMFSTPVGPHWYGYFFEDIGVYHDSSNGHSQGELGRIMSRSNPDSVVDYSGHICYYEVFEQYCACCGKEIEITIHEHVGYDTPTEKMEAEIKKKIAELGDKYATQTRIVGAVNDSTSGGILGYYPSSVSLNDLKTLSGIWSDSTNIIYDGELYNTNGNDKGGKLALAISGYGENTYANLASGKTGAEYSYTLTPTILKQIKDSNNADGVYGMGHLEIVGDEYTYNQTDKADDEPTFVHYKSTYLEKFKNEGIFDGLTNICEARASDVEQVVKKQGIYRNCRYVDYITSATSSDGKKRTFRMPFK